MVNEEKFSAALKKLREAEDKREKKVKFDQTVDLIVNLKEFDVRKHAFNVFVQLPHKIKDKRVGGFFEKDSKIVDVIKKDSFGKYKEKKEIKKLIKAYDNFIANAKLMPAVATAFGRVLGPAGKMPSPQMGIVPNEEEAVVNAILGKINNSVRIIVKEPSIKAGVGKFSLSDKDVAENALVVYKKILDNLPRGIDNVRNVKIKFTMGKPVAVEL